MTDPAHDHDRTFHETAADAAEVGKKSFAGIFGGVWVDRTNRRVHIQITTAPSPSVQGEFTRRLRHPELAVFDNVARSAAELDALRQRIVADMPSLAAKKIHVVAVGELTSLNKNQVSIGNTEATAVETLYSIYGRDAIIVRSGITIRRLAAREDPPPLAGGMQLEDGFNRCTLGFISARVSGGTASYQALTAGHCFPLGDLVLHDMIGTPSLIHSS